MNIVFFFPDLKEYMKQWVKPVIINRKAFYYKVDKNFQLKVFEPIKTFNTIFWAKLKMEIVKLLSELQRNEYLTFD